MKECGADVLGPPADGGDPSPRDARLVADMLRHTAAELARAKAEMDLLIQVVSHELREPLRTVHAYAQLLSRRYGGHLDEDARQFLAFMATGARRMHTLTDDLLDYAGLAHAALARSGCDSRAALDAALAQLADAAADAMADLRVGAMPVVMADGAMLPRLFANLVDNALCYRHPERPLVIAIDGAEVEGGWHFQIADNGVGVPGGEADRIFMVFQRLHGSERPGTGMGLPICRRIVERHGGRIWLETRPGEGATFHFTLVRPA